MSALILVGTPRWVVRPSQRDDPTTAALRTVTSNCALFKDIVEEQLCPAVIATVRTLIVQAPVVGNIFNLVIATGGKFAH